MVVLKTSLGEMHVELNEAEAPITVENFLGYIDDGFYDETIFHRVILGFMIQCGGFTADMTEKPTKDAIKNEAKNGLKNLRGTLAMARTNVVDSATSQFFISLADNPFLDHSARDFGYAVFGRVTNGIEVMDKIGAVPTGSSRGHGDVPKEAIVLEKVSRA